MICYTSIEEELKEKGTCSYFNLGTSMMPLLRQRKDLIHLSKKPQLLHKNDVVLCKYKKNSYILHRISKVKGNRYDLCGDHCLKKEKNISEEDIVGIMVAYTRNRKYYTVENIGYRIYVFLWGGRFWHRVTILYIMQKLKSLLYRVKNIFYRVLR